MTGTVTARREAVLSLRVRDTNEQEIEVEAIIDTGFTGYLTLPTAILNTLSLPLQGSREVVLGNGDRVMLDIYRAAVIWNDQLRGVQVLVAEGGTLIGMSLLYGNEVRLRVVNGGSVVIESLS